jgi:hypothetical protein
MKRTLMLTAALLMAGAASATTCSNGAKDYPACTPHKHGHSASSHASSTANASAAAQATGVGIGYGGAASALGGSASTTDSSRSSMYVFPAPVYATPLPSNLCPKGDSLAWSIGWNFFSYATSSTRTEMECLERWVEVNRVRVEYPPVKPISFLADAPMPPAPAKPKKVAKKRPVDPCVAQCKAPKTS